MQHTLHELLVFSAMAGIGAATGSCRDFILGLFGVNGRRRRASAAGAAGDLAFSLAAAAAVITGLYKLNSAAVRFYAVGGFGMGLWGYQLAVGRYVQKGADRVRALPGDLTAFLRRRR